MRALFLYSEVVLGLKVNLDKFELVAVDQVTNMDSLAGIPGCNVSYLPMKYLDLPLGATFTVKIVWDVVIEKTE